MRPTQLDIHRADPSDPAVDALVRLHLDAMHAATPVEFAFALDTSGLADPAVTLLGAWIGGELAGLGALYERNGFEPTGPFGDYAASEHNRFLTRSLAGA